MSGRPSPSGSTSPTAAPRPGRPSGGRGVRDRAGGAGLSCAPPGRSRPGHGGAPSAAPRPGAPAAATAASCSPGRRRSTRTLARSTAPTAPASSTPAPGDPGGDVRAGRAAGWAAPCASRPLRVSASEEEAEHVRRHAQALSEDGFPAELVEHELSRPPSAATRTTACSPTTTAPCTPAAGSGLWPATPKTPGPASTRTRRSQLPVPAPSEGELVTPAGTLIARHVVVTADG